MTSTRQVELNPPAAWVERFSGRVSPGGTVLDLACGSGRHGRLFHSRGHPVVMVDRDISALADLEGEPGVETIRVDLEDGSPWPLGERRFAAVVVINYLYRPLFPYIVEAVAPGGLLLYQTFARGNEKYGRPRNPDFLLEPGELLTVLGDQFDVLAFDESEIRSPRPAVIQQLAASKPPSGQL